MLSLNSTLSQCSFNDTFSNVPLNYHWLNVTFNDPLERDKNEHPMIH